MRLACRSRWRGALKARGRVAAGRPAPTTLRLTGGRGAYEHPRRTPGSVEAARQTSRACPPQGGDAGHARQVQGPALRRSEEHTSELLSLMRISYAVFCLKKNIQSK